MQHKVQDLRYLVRRYRTKNSFTYLYGIIGKLYLDTTIPQRMLPLLARLNRTRLGRVLTAGLRTRAPFKKKGEVDDKTMAIPVTEKSEKILKKLMKNNIDTGVDIMEGKEVPASSWNWVPPPRDEVAQNNNADSVIPILRNKYLTYTEINEAMSKLGGENISSVPINPPLDGSITEFVFVTGSSTRMLKKLSDVVVTALKNRNLKKAPGFSGSEGDKDDDWIVVDCFNLIVHFMLPERRKELKLEEYWSKAKPTMNYNPLREKASEELFEKLLDQIDKEMDDNNSNNDSSNNISSNNNSSNKSSYDSNKSINKSSNSSSKPFIRKL